MQHSELSDATFGSSQVNLNFITSDQYTQAYLEQLFSNKGPVAELENYFTKASERLANQITLWESKNMTGKRKIVKQSEEVHLSAQTHGSTECHKVGTMDRREDGTTAYIEEDASLKWSIVETQPEGSLT